LDALAGYDQQLLHEASRDLTTFQSPLGLLHLTALPMGHTNSVSIFHGHITFILQDEIPEKARPFIDNIVIKGPKTVYTDKDGNPETVPEHPNIWQFVLEHLEDLNRILHRLRLAWVTLSAKKLVVCVPEVTILGHKCTGEGCIPDDRSVKKILDWPPWENLTEVCGFLGVGNPQRIFIKDYAQRANALTRLTRRNVEFVWGPDQVKAFEDLKQAVTTAPVLSALDYDSGQTVYLSVDSSTTAVGWILSQDSNDGK
jgi:hypothetical protein